MILLVPILHAVNLETKKPDSVYAKVIYKKALLYNDTYSEESNGIYVIKDDRVEILDVVDNGRVWIRFRGKKIIEKYMDASAIEVVNVRLGGQEYIHSHPMGMFDEKGNRIVEETIDNLVLKKLKPNLYYYELSTLATNAHICEFKGFAKKINGLLRAQEKENCTIEFHQKEMAITIRDIDGHCKAFNCGARAYIDGIIFLDKNHSKLSKTDIK